MPGVRRRAASMSRRRRYAPLAGRVALGVVTAIGIAWCCTAQTMPLPGTPGAPPAVQWDAQRPDGSWERCCTSYAVGLTLERRRRLDEPPQQARAAHPIGTLDKKQRLSLLMDFMMSDVRRLCGWPMRCLSDRAAIPEEKRDRTVRFQARELGILPFTPIWTGLITDTALYALTWSLVIAAAHRTLARRRLRRHQCPRCAYDLTGLPAAPACICPECGTPIQQTLPPTKTPLP